MHKPERIDFTIITPVFNAADWIQETILSVLENCDGLKYEYIVINDGSTDRTLEIMEQFKNEIVIINQENQGEAKSVNNGIYAARGKYILVVSADDPMRSQTLLVRSKKIMDNDDGVVCVYPDWSMIDENSRIIKEITVEDFSIQKLVGEYICIVGPGGVFRRSSALSIQGRNTKYRYTSDYDFWLRLSQLGRFERIPESLAFWRSHPESTSIAERGEQMGRERISVMENYLNSTGKEIPEGIARSALSNAYYQAALLIYFDERVPAKSWLIRAIRIKPANIFKFNLKIMLYIALYPLAPRIMRMISKAGITLRLPDHA